MNDNNGTLYRLFEGVMEPIASAPKGMDKLRERERKMLDVLNRLFDASENAVSIKHWRAVVEGVSPPILDGKPKKLRDQQWRRAVKALTAADGLKVRGADVMPWRPADDFKRAGWRGFIYDLSLMQSAFIRLN